MAAFELEKTILKNSANLKAYYRFEGNSTDSSASGLNGTDTAITYNTSNGVYGQGANFVAASNSKISLGTSNTLNITGNMTINAWIKPSALNAYQIIFYRGSSAGYQLEINNANNTFFFSARGGNTATAPTNSLTAGVWQMVTMSKSGTNVSLYVNGKFLNTTASITVSSDSGQAAIIGQNGSNGDKYNGDMDDLAVFDTALSADQIKELYEGRYLGELRPNQFGTTVGLWHLNGNSTDFSGNNNHGTDTAITYSQANGKFGQGASFNGSSSRITKATNLGITSTTPVTMSMWVNLNAEIGSGIWCFAELMNAAASGTSQKIYYEYNSGTRRLTFSRQGSAAVTASYTIALGTTNWYHLAYVWTGGVFTGYLNGNPVATGNENGSATFTGYSAQFNLGVLNTVDNTWFANTKIDEVMVSSTALTANQIRQIYALGVGKYY